MLPERTREAEQAWVEHWSAADDTAGLVEAINEAMDGRRPLLAARLVGLLDDHVEVEPGSPIERAQRAARLVLTRKATPEDNSWSELEDAWRDVRRMRMDRIRTRMRDRMTGRSRRLGRDPRRRR